MVDTTIGAAGVIQPAEVKDVELYHPKSWVTKYVFCQDAKVIAIQYSITALSIGLVALVLSWLMLKASENGIMIRRYSRGLFQQNRPTSTTFRCHPRKCVQWVTLPNVPIRIAKT